MSEKLRYVIVDDETHASETLIWELKRVCPDASLIKVFNDPSKAALEIDQLDFDLLFLDVEMPRLNGFELLERVDHSAFKVIFTTAYDKFALKAFKVSAIDYILKPVGQAELEKAIKKYRESTKPVIEDQIAILFQHLRGTDIKRSKIALPTADGLIFKLPEQIMRCESDSNYTVVHFTEGSRHVISKTLKEIEELLKPSGFIRIHHSHLVNIDHIEKFSKKDGGYVLMDDGSHISVSRNRKEELLKIFNM